MFKAHVINDVEIRPNFQPNLGCSHMLIFKKEKKARIVYKTAQYAYKEEYLAVQKELSDSLNEVAKKGYAYCDEAVFTHNCRMGYDLAGQGQHMAIRFKKVDYTPEYRVYLGPIICIDDKELAEKETNTKKARFKIGCRSKYPSGEQHIDFYNDAYNDDTVKAANKIYRLEESSSDRKISGFPFHSAQGESESNRKYKREIEQQIEEDFQMLAKDGFKFQQLITIPVNGKERSALLFSKTGTKTLSFSSESIFLDGFELWYKPLVRGHLRRMLERIFPSYFEKKDEKHKVYINTEIEDTERLEAVYTDAFNDQSYDTDSSNQVQIPITIISKTRVPHFGENVEHLFLVKDLASRGIITTEIFRKITKQMISKADAIKKASDGRIDYGRGGRALNKEYRRNMRKLAKPHVDIFTSSIAVSIIDNNPDSPKPNTRIKDNIPPAEDVASIQDSTLISCTLKESQSIQTVQHEIIKNDRPAVPKPSKKHIGKILIYASVITILSLIGLSIPKACHNSTSSESTQSDNSLNDAMSDRQSTQELQIDNNVGVETDSDDEMYESFTGTPDVTVYYEGTIADVLSIVMSLSFYEEKIKGTLYHESAADDKFQLIGTEENTRDGIRITLTEYNANNYAIGRFVGIQDGKEYFGTFTDLSTNKKSDFSLELVPSDQSLEDEDTSLEDEEDVY